MFGSADDMTFVVFEITIRRVEINRVRSTEKAVNSFRDANKVGVR